MASYRWTQIARSLTEPPVKVIVGPEKKSYYIQRGVLAQFKHSAIGARINGLWGSAGDGAIDWTDFDCETVECVLCYFYTGDYYVHDMVAEPLGTEKDMEVANLEDCEAILMEVEQLVEQPVEDAESVETDRNTAPPSEENQSHSEQGDLPIHRPLTPLSKCIQPGLPEHFAETAAGLLADSGFQDHKENPGGDILLHVKVYAFAHRFFLSELASFSLQRLTQVLRLVDCKCTNLFPYLGDAVHLIYDATGEREFQDEPARKLISQFVAMNYPDLMGNELNTLIAEGGDFAISVTNKMARRIATSDVSIHQLHEDNKVLDVRHMSKDNELRRAKKIIEGWETWNGTLGRHSRRTMDVESDE